MHYWNWECLVRCHTPHPYKVHQNGTLMRFVTSARLLLFGDARTGPEGCREVLH